MSDSLERRALELVANQERAAAVLDSGLEQTVANLASLSPVEYDRVRNETAKRLSVRAATLDQEVVRYREAHKHTDEDKAVIFKSVEPWPEPVDGAKVLDAVEAAFERYIVLPEHAAPVLALWSAHTHAVDAFVHTPRLNVFSPEKGCGKTLVLDVLAVLTPRSLRTESISTAALFRVIDKKKPTLLIDEADTFLRDNEELRGALNAGHKRDGAHIRCVGDDHDVRPFKTFGPVALAGIGALPGTLADRSIAIRMKRALSDEIRERFDSRKTGPEQELCRKLARWAEDQATPLADADPGMPEGFYNRKADNWRPLLAIADRIGGAWPKRAREAAVALAGEDDNDSIRVQLLADIQRVYEGTGADRLLTADLLKQLLEFEDRPWSDWSHGKALTPRQLATQLKPFGIVSKSLRIQDNPKTGKGYHLEQFTDAFNRYLATPSHLGEIIRHNGTTPENKAFGELSIRHKSDTLFGTAPESGTWTTAPSCAGSGRVPDAVPDRKPFKQLKNMGCAAVPDNFSKEEEGEDWADPFTHPAPVPVVIASRHGADHKRTNTLGLGVHQPEESHVLCLHCRYWADRRCEEDMTVSDPTHYRLCGLYAARPAS